MPNKRFSLDEDGPQDLEIAWSGQLKRFTVRYRGAEVGSVPSLKEHKEGITFPLPDGRGLFAHWKTGLAPELVLLVDGKPLPGSNSDPFVRVRGAAVVTWIIAAMTGVLGVVAVATGSATLANLGVGLPSIFFGAVFATLGFFIWKRHSAAALWIAIALFAVDTVLSVAMALSSGGGAPPGVVVRVFLFVGLFRAVPAVQDLARRKAKLAAGAAGGATGAPASVPLESRRDPQP